MHIKIGDIATTSKVFTLDEVRYYAESSADTNPVHYDFDYAYQTIFKKPIVQGLFVASLFGGLLGTHIPGKGTIHLGQSLKFMKPVFVNEEIQATIKVIQIRQDKPIITFECTVIKSDKTIAISGEAVVMYKGDFFI